MRTHTPTYKTSLPALCLVLCLLLGPVGCKTPAGTETPEPEVRQPDFQLEAAGREETLEIATWNIKNFPSRGESTILWVAEAVKQLDLDILALQEIADIDAFGRLLSLLPGYDGSYSDDVYADGYQKTGIIYKTGLVTVRAQAALFEDETYPFPRPPLLLDILAQKGGKVFDFYLIVVHLKAYDDEESRERRRLAAEILKDYLDTRIASPVLEKDYVVAGDWNDQIDDPENENAFWNFISDPAGYRFLTLPLVGDPGMASYPGRDSLIDHILVSADCLFEYGNGECRTLRLDDRVGEYFDYVSDHRPVMARFPVF